MLLCYNIYSIHVYSITYRLTWTKQTTNTKQNYMIVVYNHWRGGQYQNKVGIIFETITPITVYTFEIRKCLP